jgi:diaminopimelate epimerase
MCGNGIRCLAKFAYERGLTAAEEIDVSTRAGIRHLVLTVEDGAVSGVTVAMGPPSLERRSLPMAGDPASTHVGTPIEVGGRTFASTAVSMGNPHLVLMLDPAEDLAAMDAPRLGSHLENRADLFPNRTNVEFVKVIDGRIHMRVWERGSGETMACGTGACAALVACSLAGLVGREAEIEFPGGVLLVEWRPDEELYLTGPAVCVFDGELDSSWLSVARPEAAEVRR